MPTGESYPRCEFNSEDIVFSLRRRVAGTVEAIEPVVDEIMSLVVEQGCAKDDEFEISLALREALANAVLYGCRNDPNQFVEVCVGCDEQRGILIVIRDPGEGFDPDSIPSPIVGQNVFSKGGRGIFLINELMDEVSFERGGTEIRMVKRGCQDAPREPNPE